MKNMFICFMILVLIFGGVGGYFFIKNTREKARIEEIRKNRFNE